MSTRCFVVGVAAGLMLCTSPALAQSTSAQPSTDEWQLEVVPYLWGSAIEGPIGIGNRTADVDASFAQHSQPSALCCHGSR